MTTSADLPQIESRWFAEPNDLLKLVSAQIVLKVLNDSIQTLQKSSGETTSTTKPLVEANKPPANKSNPENYVSNRKHLNTKRWHCVSRPQYKFSCGISSLVSCWNYLYSSLGYGKLKPLSQEEALRILGFEPPFDQIRFGPFTGNKTLMKWFKELNKHFKVDGQPSFFYKPVAPNRTPGVTSQLALERLQTLLKSKNHAFIYHCYNHYFCPVGFEREPKSQEDIYSGENEDFIEWLLVAESSRKYPALHCFKWDDIERDLTTKSPEYLNIRKLERGVQTRGASAANVEKTSKNNEEEVSLPRLKKEGRNLHCLIMFQSFESLDKNGPGEEDTWENDLKSASENPIDEEEDEEDMSESD